MTLTLTDTLAARVQRIQALASRIDRPVRFMEVCGTHTMAAFQSGLRSLLPPSVSLLSGPGCPVCVTPVRYIDIALALAQLPDITICSFGDMIRVPGSDSSLEKERARGATVRVVYSPMDALQEAAAHPERRVVFLGVGFETTAPATAWVIRRAAQDGIKNLRMLSAHKTMPTALRALVQSGLVDIDGFLLPGHVSAILGLAPYEFLCREFQLSCVIAGFEADDMLKGIEQLLLQRVESRAVVENAYPRGVPDSGNQEALAAIQEIFEPCVAEWRGLGLIPDSGLKLRKAYAGFDAERDVPESVTAHALEPAACRCGDVLRGLITPMQCPLFECACTPSTPIGACMVSSEGACAAYYKYARHRVSLSKAGSG